MSYLKGPVIIIPPFGVGITGDKKNVVTFFRYKSIHFALPKLCV